MDNSSVHLEKVIDKLSREIIINKSVFDKFKVRFEEDSIYALEWADDLFYTETKNVLFKQVLEAISNGKKRKSSDKDILENLTKFYLNRLITSITCNTGSSTSTCSNLLKKAEHVALAELYGYLTKEWSY